VSALAVLIPQQRGYATEPSTSNSSQSYPPPGFNAEQAKKPLPLDQAQSSRSEHLPAANSDAAPVSKASAQSSATKGAGTEDQKNAAKKEKKLTLGQKIKKEAQHYWDGTKLLATEVKISSRLALKMAAGYELSRREHRQVRSNSSILLESHMLILLFCPNSSNVLPRILVVWFPSLCSSLFPSPSSSSPWP